MANSNSSWTGAASADGSERMRADLEAAALREALAGDALCVSGQPGAAQSHFAEAVRLHPGHARYHWLLGVTESSSGSPESAGASLQRAVQLDAGLGPAQSSLGYWYLTQGMVAEALQASAKAVALLPMEDGVLATHAWVLESAGELEEAWAIARRLIQRENPSTAAVLLYGRLAQHRGEQERVLGLIAHLLEGAGLATSDRISLNFTAGRLLDSLGQYDDAFAHFVYANAVGRRPYVPAIHEATVDRLVAGYTPRHLGCLPRATYRSDVPVFIVGMPRSGTSLVEQILASHPAVYGAGELDFMGRVLWGTLDMLEADVSEFPACLDRLTVAQANGMAQIYLCPLRAMNPAAARITDKMPLNFLHLDLIQLLLPDARVIHCRRNPMDTCLSCYTMAFPTGNNFKYDLSHLGQFYRLYDRLMEHWKQVLDLPILDVQYEDLVSDPTGQMHRMVEFAGLEWNDQCLKFHETRRSVATGSMQQVRKPLYKSSVERWRNYEKHLGPLKAALGVA